MEIDIHPDDTEVLLDEGFCTTGGGGRGHQNLLGACSML